jgi:DNA-binding NarL/FixJ family response regulator
MDDEGASLDRLLVLLRDAGYQPVVTHDEAGFREVVEREGSEEYVCAILGDIVAGKSGLEAAAWLAQHDLLLRRVILCEAPDVDFMRRALKLSVDEVIPRSASGQELVAAITATVAHTRALRRKYGGTLDRRGFRKIHRQMAPPPLDKVGLAPDYAKKLEQILLPSHMAGGDFCMCVPIDSEKAILIAGDISGHDIRAGFLSVYFTGICRGMRARGATAAQMCQHFNDFLTREWNPRREPDDVPSSLCVCFVMMDFAHKLMYCMSNGFPSPILFNDKLDKTEMGYPSPPLGWFDRPLDNGRIIPMPESGTLVMFSDGLSDLSTPYGPCICGMADRILTLPEDNPERMHLLIRQRDDIAILRMAWARREDEGRLVRVLACRRFRGDEISDIDLFQHHWDNLLSKTIPNLPIDRKIEILLCLREAVLNAMKHGCAGSSSLGGGFVIALCGNEVLRIRIDDAGAAVTNAGDSHDGHISFGIRIIEGLSDSCRYDISRKCLFLDFDVTKFFPAQTTTIETTSPNANPCR